MRTRLVVVMVVLGAASVLGQGTTQRDAARVTFEAAKKVESVDGDLRAAIDLYRKVSESADRELAAQAELRIAAINRTLGDGLGQIRRDVPVTGPAFEVASVRPAPYGSTSQRMTDSRVDLTSISLRALLMLAFRAKNYELVGPDWLAETRVTIQATMPPGATRQQVPEMLQRLLAERFHLVVHREPRPMDVYELSVDTSGHRMLEVGPADELDKTFSVSKAAQQFREQFGTAAALDSVQDTPEGPVRTVFGEDLGRTTLTPRTMYKLTLNMDRLGRRTQTLDATRITMAELAALLTTNMGEPVLDRTNLPRTYQFNGIELPLDARVLDMARKAAGAEGRPFEAPSVSQAKAMAGLGLRLERRRASVDVIVIDSIDRVPTDN